MHCNASQCHQGIEDIAQAASGMTSAITSMGEEAGDPKGCVVCHGGNPAASNREAAHTGSPATIIEMNGPNRFLSDPGSPWVNEKTCGLCHKQYVSAQWNSLMMTEAGKLQGMAWAFGSQTGYEHVWANYDAENPQKPEERIGTDAYRTYMAELRQKEPNVFPDKHTKAPEAPTDLNELEKHPEKAALTYARVECQRCHLGVKGRQKRGDYRGMGCSACHIPYSNEGLYEGGDQSVPEDEPGHLLVHAIQSGGNIEVNGTKYSGIPVESCTTCHDRGKRIGVSFQGLMESAYHSPFTEGGGGQAALHTKHYLPMRPDVHLQKGMLCHDCHTTSDIHGDRFLKGTTLAAVEIECSDCHGTPWDYPWELPLGFGEEFGDDLKERQGRGVIVELPQHMRQDVVYPAKDGYLITARGNPMRRAVRNGNEVILHSAGGKELKLSPLKLKAQSGELSLEARVGMVSVKGHINKMECYTCHAGWAPQCYGCHVKIDYSKGNKSFDWVAAGQRHQDPEYAADKSEAGYNTTVPGHVEEQRSYMRWEDPPMVVNGEGRMSPAIPGCQVSATIVGPDGKTIKKNHIFRTMPDSEGSGPQGQLGLDMSPVNPHTSGKARSCASCHASPKALGYGIDRGELNRPWNESVVVDLATADGKVIPKKARSQIEPIPGLEADWSRFVTEGGKQLQTVGHHFSRSRPLNDKERNNTEREGVCLACHQDIPDDPAVNLLHHVAAHLDVLPDSDKTHADLLNKIALGSAWAQVIAPVTFAMLLLAGAWWFLRRRAGR
ncbi:MAG: cytochrome C [Proteobacteria bacterium]|nr:cytochrome C [Pseudomonadota bacterium]